MPTRTPLQHPPSPRPLVRRVVPPLTLGVTALALAVTATLPASAAPRAGDQRPTAAARAAGVQPGNAPMGWRERGTERAALQTAKQSLMRSSAASRSSITDPFTPKGVLGIDVSSYQGKVAWSTWKGSKRDFAYIKATEGTTYRSPSFKSQYSGAKKAGLIRGAYHFASPSGQWGSKQARYFVRHGGGWTPDGSTLPGVLDIEYNPYGATCYGLSKKKMVRWITSFLNEYKKLTGKDAVIYTTTDWWTRCTGNTNRYATRNPLWIARYGTTEPGKLPKGWRNPTFWQYTATPIDQDVFPSKRARLTVLATKI